MKIAMVASEINPLVKSGGLADVVYSLSKELVIKGEEVCCVLPYYQSIRYNGKLKTKRLGSFEVSMAWRKQSAEVFRTYIDGITFYLIGNDYYFDRESLYGYDDDGERFAFFTLASEQLFKFVHFQPDVIHVHDWQVGMLPVLIKEKDPADPFYGQVKTVLTIHNPAFKGMLDRYFLNNFYGLSDELFDNGSVRFDGMVSTLKSGIVYSDRITTVSPNHAQELLSSEGGKGLDGILKLRQRDFVGILNGIDTAEFNPAGDRLIASPYDAKTFQIGKKLNRERLLQTNLLTDNGGPIYGFVSRLTSQKGIDLILRSMPHLLNEGTMLVALGSGEFELERGLENLRSAYPKQVGVFIGFNNVRAHEIYAGSDFFLMPSLFEPCGIGQMIAQRYGTLPIVRSTGGLKDTVTGYDGQNGDKANGLSFETYDEGGLTYACGLAQKLFDDKKAFGRLVVNAMELDRSWNKSADEYLKVYHSLVG